MCKVDILDKTDKCPLCNHVLEWDGSEKEELYPNARIQRRKYQFLENVFLFYKPQLIRGEQIERCICQTINRQER